MVDIVAGWIDVNTQAAQIILINIMVILYFSAAGFEQAACAFVGQYIGKGDAVRAKDWYHSFVWLVSVWIIIVIILNHTFRE